eukprot:TRINITY_DN12577_c0_g1_i1.p1 TRINITY_DN12577_c0_g1~~TRINITY_DN12577_c0_g1_i1.p1  ORF type:complete len:427 (+),score=55.15 TRINITY_DN12577_c0_g1_i1:106-1386(+)
MPPSSGSRSSGAVGTPAAAAGVRHTGAVGSANSESSHGGTSVRSLCWSTGGQSTASAHGVPPAAAAASYPHPDTQQQDAAALARAIGRRGPRCRVCGNPALQPFCGMTGLPHSKAARHCSKAVFDDDVLTCVYAFLTPTEALRVRMTCRLWARVAMQPVLWEGHVAFMESLNCLSCAPALRKPLAQRSWCGVLCSLDPALLGDLRGPLPRFPHLQNNTPLRRYRGYCRLGVLRWRDELANALPPDVTVLSDHDGRDLVELFAEYQVCTAQIGRLTMVHWDDLHDLLNRAGGALHSLREVMHRHHQRPRQLGRLRVLRHAMQGFVDVATKVDQWMNCATEPVHWDTLRQVCAEKRWGQLPKEPSACPVSVVLGLFNEGRTGDKEELKLVWDAILATAIYDQPPPPDDDDAALDGDAVCGDGGEGWSG